MTIEPSPGCFPGTASLNGLAANGMNSVRLAGLIGRLPCVPFIQQKNYFSKSFFSRLDKIIQS